MKVDIKKYPYDGNEPREVSVRIDHWDTFSADHTLALIIAPLLQKIRANNQGAPFVDDVDVPEHLHRGPTHDKEDIWHTDYNWRLRWLYVLDEMIWSMQEIASDKSGEDQFFDNSEIDEKGLKEYLARLQKGCELFGKYFQSLWS